MASAAPRATPPVVVVDTHTHFGDPARPKPALFRTALPADYKALAGGGVSGTVVTESAVGGSSAEASGAAGLADNDWTLALADRDPFILGLVGDLDPYSEAFPAQLRRYAADPRFVGFRLHPGCCGRRYAGDPTFGAGGLPPRLLRNLADLAARGLVLDLHGDVSHFPFFEALLRAVPTLRVVINHIGECRPVGAPPPEWRGAMERIGACPRVYCKVSALVQMAGGSGPAPSDPEYYHPVLEVLWAIFGGRRLIYASNWPQIEATSDLSTAFHIVASFFAGKGDEASALFFAGNAERVYRWGRPKPVLEPSAL